MEDHALGKYAVDSWLFTVINSLGRCALPVRNKRVRFKSSSLCQIEDKAIENMSSKATYIFKINSPSDRLIHIHILFNKKKTQLFPEVQWEFTVTSMQIRKTILHQHANHHTSVCVRDENKVSQWDEERKNYTSNFKKRNRHRRTAHVVLRENPMFDRRDLKLSPLFSIWILSDVTVDASTKKNTCTYTMCSVQRFISPWTKTKRERRVKAHPCLCL